MEAEPSIPSDSLRSQISKFSTMLTKAYKRKSIHYWILLALSILAMLVAFPASSILSRVYYDNGGQSKWIISWVAVAGWPLTALILFPVYFIIKTFPINKYIAYIIMYDNFNKINNTNIKYIERKQKLHIKKKKENEN